jgi:hypothetical protein
MTTNDGSTTVRPLDPCRVAIQHATRLLDSAQFALERADELLTALPTNPTTPAIAQLQGLLLASRATRGVLHELLESIRYAKTNEPLIRPLPLPDVTEWLKIEVHE